MQTNLIVKGTNLMVIGRPRNVNYPTLDEKVLITECSDGRFRQIEIDEYGNIDVYLDKVWCEAHRTFHYVQTDKTGKVIDVIVPRAC